MKKIIKIAFTMALAAGLVLPPALSAQPGAALPSEEVLQMIQSNAELPGNTLPSERAYAEIRAERPIDEVPIGGLDAPAPSPTLSVMLAFALTAAVSLKRRRELKTKN